METNFVITKILRVVMVGKGAYPDGRASFSPNMRCNELIFHFLGQATVYFDDLELQTRPNTIRFLPKGKASRYDVRINEPGECIAIAFESDVPISDKAFVMDASQKQAIGLLFRKIFASWMAKEDGSYFECVSLLYKIFAEMQKQSYSSYDHYKKIKPAVDSILEGFLQEDITVESLARQCNMSQSYFKRLFKEKYGLSPKKYIIQLKMNHACELLLLEQYSVTQIAELCNFSDVYFFSRQFKEYMGITPTQFIKKYKSSK